MNEDCYSFYGKHDLANYAYYYHLPELSSKSRIELSGKIAQHSGKITLTLSTNSIIIIQDLIALEQKDFKKEIKAFGNIELYHDNNVFNVTHNPSIQDKNLKCILLKDFELALNQYDINNQEYDKLIEFGLPKYTEKKSLVACYLPLEIDKTVHYYQFSRLSSDKLKYGKSEFDVITYMPFIPGGFSVFCSLEEKYCIMNYLSKDSINKKRSHNEIDKQNNACNDNNGNNQKINNFKYDREAHLMKKRQKVLMLPEPNKEHLYCNFCKKKFKDYYNHIKGVLHLENVTKNKECYDRLEKTFERIRKYNKDKEHHNNNEDDYSLSYLTNKQEDKETQETQIANKIQTDKYSIYEIASQTQSSTTNSSNNKLSLDINKFGKRKYSQFVKDHFLNLGGSNGYLQIKNSYKIKKSKNL